MKASRFARWSVRVLIAGMTFAVGWKVMDSRVDAETTLGFVNVEPFPLSIVKLTVDDRVIYEGLPIEHPPRVHPMYFHLFKFRAQARKAHLAVVAKDDKGGTFITDAELRYRDKGCEFICNLRARSLQCGCIGSEMYKNKG